ncbi:type I restriction-modification system methyltransferase subunit [Lactococcus lactis subsp. lactis]|uniref:Type I restriction-modification system methyltransferase subunit n=2 Tax=Lactococcus lactis subsp. lactis TaxID=1360 RepID=A0A0B8QV18_LACLL|nr:type I restriction-modification system methyltransferase subunit [Lactococcus lactis subsp. lactis]
MRAGLMIVPLADRLEAIVTFAFDESRGTLGAFEVEAFISEPELVELAVSNEL